MKSTYTAYGSDNTAIKKGVVSYNLGDTDDETVNNFCEAVVQDVGEELFEEKVFGIKD